MPETAVLDIIPCSLRKKDGAHLQKAFFFFPQRKLDKLAVLWATGNEGSQANPDKSGGTK